MHKHPNKNSAITNDELHELLSPSSATSGWQTLIAEASKACNIAITEDLESYLVFMLMRFTKIPEISKKAIALELLHGLQSCGHAKKNALRDVGDICLIVSGFFPERATKQQLNTKYYINIGKLAYTVLSETICELSQLYARLNENFILLTDILSKARTLHTAIGKNKTINAMAAVDLLSEINSPHTLASLQKVTKNTNFTIIKPSDSKH